MTVYSYLPIVWVNLPDENSKFKGEGVAYHCRLDLGVVLIKIFVILAIEFPDLHHVFESCVDADGWLVFEGIGK